MINKIAGRGKDIGGLVRYLLGPERADPQRANEHVDQRIIAADAALDLDDGTRLDRPEHWPQVLDLARDMDANRRLSGVAPPDGWVWHCAISLPPGEALTDAQWAEVARTAVERLGFTGSDEAGRAPCRWIAVHHGPSKRGNDHIHIAVNLVREDGTVAAPGLDRKEMSRVCGEMERRYGLRVLEGRAGRGMPGYSRAEAERARRQGRSEPDRHTLARTVRACATAAASEDEFVRLLADAGLWARPRYAAGGRAAVTGYSVALRPDDGAAPVWIGGGRLAADLTLPRLRGHWVTIAPHLDRDAARAQALTEWRYLAGDGPAGQPASRKTGVYTADQAAARINAVRERLRAVPYQDTAAWATCARQAAGIFASLSARLEEGPGPLAQAADALARSAQTRPTQPRYARHSGLAGLGGVALAVLKATTPPRRPDPWVTLIRQLLHLAQTIADIHLRQHQAHHAAALRAIAVDHLNALDRATGAGRLSAVDYPAPPIPARRNTRAGSRRSASPTTPIRPPRPRR